MSGVNIALKLSSFYTGTKLCCIGTEAHCVRIKFWPCRDVIRTRDPLIASLTRYAAETRKIS